MGISFEEILGSMGRWLDRVGGEIGWRWRARSMSGGLDSGRLREYFETASDWLTEKWRALMWWMQVRGINTDRLIPAGPVSWKRIARWGAVVLVGIVCFIQIPRAWAPEEATPLTDQDVTALASLRVPFAKAAKAGNHAPEIKQAKPESALKAWLLQALGLR